MKFFERVKLERRRDALQKEIRKDAISVKDRQSAELMLAQTDKDLQVCNIKRCI